MKSEQKREQATRDFLLELALSEKLAECHRGDDAEIAGAGLRLKASAPRPYDADVRVGQIRLMPDSAEIAYVAVVARWDWASWLVVPFSTFDVPATDTEMKLREYDGGMSLSVAQAWNARTWHTETLAKSWFVGTLPKEDVADVMSLVSYSLGGSRPSDDVMSCTALPITDVDDPRIGYRARALATFVPIDQIDDAVEAIALPSVFAQEKSDEGELALAAGERVGPTILRADCRIKGFAGVVRVVYNVDRKMLELKAKGKDGAPTKKLDGWTLVTGDGVELGNVADGRIVCRDLAEFDGACCLVDGKGAAHAIVPRKSR